jgi:hypothetical protein
MIEKDGVFSRAIMFWHKHRFAAFLKAQSNQTFLVSGS